MHSLILFDSPATFSIIRIGNISCVHFTLKGKSIAHTLVTKSHLVQSGKHAQPKTYPNAAAPYDLQLTSVDSFLRGHQRTVTVDRRSWRAPAGTIVVIRRR